MAHVLKPRVAETSTTTGTGAFTLSGALTGHQRFSDVCSTSDTTEYVIVAEDGTWEEGFGTYSSANTLTRTTVSGSSNAGAAVNFAAGNKTVLMTPQASRVGGIPRSSALMKGDGAGALSAASAGTDYQAAITASGVLKGAGSGSVSAATAGTDYLAPPSGTAILKANSGGALANAVAGTDYVAPGGALGTPSSGTVTNLTGTASININGTVGATTPTTGAFTSITSTSASGVLTRAAATQDGVALVGRAGGTSSYEVTLTPTTLAADRTITLPDASGVAVLDTATQTLTNKTLTDPTIVGAILEDVFTITDGASVDINPSNGTIQVWTLGASRTPTATNFLAGESITLMVDDGTAYTITWTTIGVVWETDGGTAPTLSTSGYTTIVLWKVGSTVYGARVGNA